MTDHHWLLYLQKVHAVQSIQGESRFLTRCGQRLHPLLLSQPKDEDARCKVCQMSLERRE